MLTNVSNVIGNVYNKVRGTQVETPSATTLRAPSPITTQSQTIVDTSIVPVSAIGNPEFQFKVPLSRPPKQIDTMGNEEKLKLLFADDSFKNIKDPGSKIHKWMKHYLENLINLYSKKIITYSTELASIMTLIASTNDKLKDLYKEEYNNAELEKLQEDLGLSETHITKVKMTSTEFREKVKELRDKHFPSYVTKVSKKATFMQLYVKCVTKKDEFEKVLQYITSTTQSPIAGGGKKKKNIEEEDDESEQDNSSQSDADLPADTETKAETALPNTITYDKHYTITKYNNQKQMKNEVERKAKKNKWSSSRRDQILIWEDERIRKENLINKREQSSAKRNEKAAMTTEQKEALAKQKAELAEQKAAQREKEKAEKAENAKAERKKALAEAVAKARSLNIDEAVLNKDPPKVILKNLVEQLQSVVKIIGGLTSRARQNVRDKLSALVLNIGYPEVPDDEKEMFLNYAVLGDAGLGKTKAAGVIGKVFSKTNLLINVKDKINEYTPKDFKGEYLGQSSIKAYDVLMENLESVMFIDEAYGFGDCERLPNGGAKLNNGTQNQYGREALEEMLVFCDKFQGMSSIIIAGYAAAVNSCFFGLNSGLHRRFPHKLILQVYSSDELIDLFKNHFAKKLIENGYKFQGVIEDFITEKGGVDTLKYFNNQGGDMQNIFGYFKTNLKLKMAEAMTEGIDIKSHDFEPYIKEAEKDAVANFTLQKESERISEDDPGRKKEMIPRSTWDEAFATVFGSYPHAEDESEYQSAQGSSETPKPEVQREGGRTHRKKLRIKKTKMRKHVNKRRSKQGRTKKGRTKRR